jgi:hypothetical protein
VLDMPRRARVPTCADIPVEIQEEASMADPGKKYIAFPSGRKPTREEAREMARQLFDAINAERSAQPRVETPPVALTSGTVDADGDEERLVYLRSERTGEVTRYLTARRVASGDLWIEGQDMGPWEHPLAPDGEYEWVWAVPADQVPAFLSVLGAEPDADVLDVLAAHWSGAASAELEARLRASGLAKLTVL